MPSLLLFFMKTCVFQKNSVILQGNFIVEKK